MKSVLWVVVFVAVIALYLGNFIFSEVYRVAHLAQTGELIEVKSFPITGWGLYAVLPVDGKRYHRVDLQVSEASARENGDFNAFVYHYSRFPKGFLHDRIRHHVLEKRDDQLQTLLRSLVYEWLNSEGRKTENGGGLQVDIRLIGFEANAGKLSRLPDEDRHAACVVLPDANSRILRVE